jgi:hypothetical protein
MKVPNYIDQQTTDNAVVPVSPPTKSATPATTVATPATPAPVASATPKPTEPVEFRKDAPFVSINVPTPQVQTTDTGATVAQTSAVVVLQGILRQAGFPKSLVDKAGPYALTLIQNQVPLDSITDVMYGTETFTYTDKQGNPASIKSPYFEEYGPYINALKSPKPASELIPLVNGYIGLVDQYAPSGVSEKFKDPETIKGYLKNGVSVETLSKRFATAQIRGNNADPAYVNALVSLGYATSGQDARTAITNFFLDPTIGQQELESRQATVGIAAEAGRVGLSAANAKTLASSLIAQGYTPEQAQAKVAQDYSKIASESQKAQRLSNIQTGTPDALNLQTELENQNILGRTSSKVEQMAQKEENLFQSQSGMFMPYRYGSRAGAFGTGSTEGQL